MPKLRERGTVQEPNQLAEGARYVLVNGRLALREGRFEDARHGEILRAA